MLWKDDFDFEVLHLSKHHIHGGVRVKSECNPRVQALFLNGVYGHPKLAHRGDMWSLIKSIGRGCTQLGLFFLTLTRFSNYLRNGGQR